MTRHKGKPKFYIVCPTPADQSGINRHISTLGLRDIRAYQTWCVQQGFAPTLQKHWRQRERERQRAQALASRARAQAAEETHYRSLGFRSLTDYHIWCQERGLRTTPFKNEEQYKRECETAEQEEASRVLIRRHTLFRRPSTFLNALESGQITPCELRGEGQRLLYQLYTQEARRTRERAIFVDLLRHFSTRADIFSIEPILPEMPHGPQNTLAGGLLQLAFCHGLWMRPLQTWRSETRHPRRQFASLAKHLLAEYDVPEWLDAAWFCGLEAGRPYRDWFLHVGGGLNLRTAVLPIVLTKKMAHFAMKAPGALSPIAALRWGQVRGMGGSTYLAEALLGTRLRRTLLDEPFWATVVQFFVNHPMVAPSRIGAIVDYLYDQRLVPQDVLLADGRIERIAPPQPTLSMQGRSVPALLERAEAWHRQLARPRKNPPGEWPASGIAEYRLIQESSTTGERTLWTVRELCNTRALQAEGAAMHNCVATYASSCQSGECAIFSLRAISTHQSRERSIVTIEVSRESRMIVQARGQCNRVPGDPGISERLRCAPEILRLWAEQTGLTFASYAW